jgi:hypothetical protein
MYAIVISFFIYITYHPDLVLGITATLSADEEISEVFQIS